LGHIPLLKLVSLYQHCQAFIFFHEEDFGLTAVEAMAAGKPVIALNRGGATETVIPNLTGVLINNPSAEALAQAVTRFDPHKFNPELITAHAQKFSQERFYQEFAKVFTQEWRKFQNANKL
jgi:glycosyltransferase involved in cell wall biosynthesis